MMAECSSIRPLTRALIPEAVTLHVAAFRNFYLTALGPRFLRQYYRCVVEYAQGICLGAFDEGTLIGFVAGFVDPSSFYQDLRAARFTLGLAAFPALIGDPRRILRFIINYRRAGSIASRTAYPRTTAELASLAVHPAFEGRGIGGYLVRTFVSNAFSRGAARVILTTDAHGNNAVNLFYKRMGFQLMCTFEAQPGRILNEYSISAQAVGDPRV